MNRNHLVYKLVGFTKFKSTLLLSIIIFPSLFSTPFCFLFLSSSLSLLLELNSLQKSLTGVRAELHEKEKALRKSEKSMTQLREELLEMEGLVNRKMVPKSELETVTRQMEEKVHILRVF